MSDKEFDFLNGLKKTLWQVSATIITAVILASFSFYFNTSNRLNNVEEKQKLLDVKKADKNVYEITIQEIKDDISEIKDDVKDLKKINK